MGLFVVGIGKVESGLIFFMYIDGYQCDEQVVTYIINKVNLKRIHLNKLKHVLYKICLTTHDKLRLTNYLQLSYVQCVGFLYDQRDTHICYFNNYQDLF